MAEGCLFCDLVAGKIASDMLYQDKDFFVFRDINPQAPKHVLIIPKIHVASLAELSDEQHGLMGSLILLAKKLAEDEGMSRTGYRLVLNCGPEGGQVVPHIHFHLLGGRKLSSKLG